MTTNQLTFWGLLSLFCLAPGVMAQNTDFPTSVNKTYAEEFEDQFNFNPNDVPFGYLYDRVYPTADLENIGPCDTVLAQTIYQGWWEMENAQWDPNRSNLFASVRQEVRNTILKPNLPIVALDFKSASLDPAAFEDGRLQLVDGKYQMVGDESPFTTFRVQMAGLASNEVQVETPYLVYFEPQFFMHNTQNDVQSVELTNYASQQVHAFMPGEVIELTFAETGEQVFGIEVNYTDGSTSCNKFVVEVKEKLYKKKASCEDGEMFLVESDIPYKGLVESHATTSIGDAHIYYHTTPENQCKVIKPIIIVDGFDPMDVRQFDDLKAMVNYTTGGNNENLIKDLRLLGYDVIILNFPVLGSEAIQYKSEVKQFKDGEFDRYVNKVGRDGGADYVERNGFLTVKLIQTVNDMLVENSSNEELVVIGPSMGGLITRYALSYMEAQQSAGVSNMNHNTRLWISFDAPHNGANIPFNTQVMVDFFGNYKGEQDVVDMFNTRLRSKAARQMLLEHYESLWNTDFYGSKAHYNALVASMKSNGIAGSDGWPVNVRKVSVMNGNLNGEQSFWPSTNDINISLASGNTDVFKVDMRYAPDTYQNDTVFIGRYAIKKFTGIRFKSTPLIGTNGLTGSTHCVNFIKGIFHEAHVKYENSNIKGSLDVVPGAFYPPVNEISDMLIKKINEAKSSTDILTVTKSGSNFTFIPSVSAAGLRKPNYHWSKSFQGQNVVCAGLSYFDNIFIPEHNEYHIQVTPANAKWILQEVERGQVGCEKMCAEADAWPTQMCKGTSSDLKLKDLPQVTSYSILWNVDNSFSINSGQSTFKANVTALKSMPLNPFRVVTAVISPTCAADHYVRRNIEIPNTSLDVSGNDKICAHQETYECTSNSQASNHYWYYGDVHGVYKTYNPYSTIAPPTNSSSSDPNVRRYTDFGGSRIGNYTIFVEADNVCGETMSGMFPVSIVPKSSCDQTLKGFEQFDMPDLVVYPNPTADHWTLFLRDRDDRIQHIDIFNMKGQLVQSLSNQNQIVDLVGDDLPNGFYFILITTEAGKQITYKLVKRPAGL